MQQAVVAEQVASAGMNYEKFEKMRWQIMASIIGPVAWLSFTLLYVGFWAQGFSLFQSVIVILVSALILAGVMGAVWTAWGRRHGEWFEK